MNTYNQLPGHPLKKARATGWLLVLALFCAAAFFVVHYAPSFHETKSEAVRTTRPTFSVSLPDAEDLQRHLNNASAGYQEASSTVARSRYWGDRALSSLDDVPAAARRLQLARSASQTAEAQMKRAQEELELAISILTERSDQK